MKLIPGLYVTMSVVSTQFSVAAECMAAATCKVLDNRNQLAMKFLSKIEFDNSVNTCRHALHSIIQRPPTT